MSRAGRRAREKTRMPQQDCVRLGAGGVTGEHVGEPGQRQDSAADQAVAERPAADLGWVVGAVQQPQTGRQVRASRVG